jgi:hypothetical protein
MLESAYETIGTISEPGEPLLIRCHIYRSLRLREMIGSEAYS